MWLSVILQAAMIIAMIVLAFTLGGVNAFSIIISILFLIIFVLLAISLRNSIGLAAALVGGAARAVQKNWGMQVHKQTNNIFAANISKVKVVQSTLSTGIEPVTLRLTASRSNQLS